MRLQTPVVFVVLALTSGAAGAAPVAAPALGDPRTDRMTFAHPRFTTVMSDPTLGVWAIGTNPSTSLSPFAVRNPWSTLPAFYLAGANDFMFGFFTLQSSRLTLRLPKVFGIEPLVAGGAAGRSSFTDLGLRYAFGHFEAGTRLTLSRFDVTGESSEIASTSFVQYRDEHMSLGLSHWAALALIRARPASASQSMGGTVGLTSRNDGSFLYANVLVPLKAYSTTHVSAFGRF
jgi:hypothetical protein